MSGIFSTGDLSVTTVQQNAKSTALPAPPHGKTIQPKTIRKKKRKGRKR